MKYEEFIEKVKDEVSLRIGEEKSVDVYSILKNNGIRYEGLIIKESTLNIHLHSFPHQFSTTLHLLLFQ